MKKFSSKLKISDGLFSVCTISRSNFCAQNYEKICRITWAQPLLLLATTEFSELVSVTFKTDVPAIKYLKVYVSLYHLYFRISSIY